jgi:hypothetical protein
MINSRKLERVSIERLNPDLIISGYVSKKG